MGYIYKITCNVPGKQGVYIGQTTRTVQARWKQHINHAKYGKCYIGRMINKYGVQNFTVQTLCQLQSKEELDAKQIQLIAQYRAKGKSYNISQGGQGVVPTEELRRKWQESNYRNHSVIHHQTGIQYFSASQAARKTGLCRSDICDCCRMRLKQTKGSHFRYPQIPLQQYQVYWKQHSEYQLGRNMRVKNLITQKQYKSAAQASRQTGMDRGSILRHAKNKVKHPCWIFVD